jgi:hypothetical protein
MNFLFSLAILFFHPFVLFANCFKKLNDVFHVTKRTELNNSDTENIYIEREREREREEEEIRCENGWVYLIN